MLFIDSLKIDGLNDAAKNESLTKAQGYELKDFTNTYAPAFGYGKVKSSGAARSQVLQFDSFLKNSL